MLYQFYSILIYGSKLRFYKFGRPCLSGFKRLFTNKLASHRHFFRPHMCFSRKFLRLTQFVHQS